MKIQDFEHFTEFSDFADIVSSVFGDMPDFSPVEKFPTGKNALLEASTDSINEDGLEDFDLREISDVINSFNPEDGLKESDLSAAEKVPEDFSVPAKQESGEVVLKDDFPVQQSSHLQEDAPEFTAMKAELPREDCEPAPVEFDPRFNIQPRSSKAHHGYSYGGKQVSSAREAGYTPAVSHDYEEIRSSYTEEDSYDALFRDRGKDAPPPKGLKKITSFAKRLKPAAHNAQEITEASDAQVNASVSQEKSPMKSESNAFPEESSSQANYNLTHEEFAENSAYSQTDNASAFEEFPEAPSSAFRIRFRAEKKTKDNDDEQFAEEANDIGDELAGEYEGESEYLHSSFGKYLYSRLAAFLLKVRGYFPANTTAASMMQEDENLGAEVLPLAASKYYGAQISSLRTRTRVASAIVLLMAYLSSGLPTPGMLKSLYVATAAVMAAQFTVLLLCLDVVTNAITKTFRRKIGIDTLAVVACLFTSFDGIAVLNSANVYKHIPLCVVSSLSILGVMYSSLFSTRALRKAMRVPGIAKTIYSVTTEDNVTGHDVTLLKSDKSISGFVRRVEEAPADEVLFGKASPFLLILAFAATLLVCIFKRSFENILYIFSVMLSAAVPFTALLCFALPFFEGSNRIFSSGAALAGWSGIFDIGNSRTLIVTDRDLFPPEKIEISSVRIFADYDADKVISYVSSLIIASGSGLVPAFKRLMDDNNCEKIRIDNLKFLAGGGVSGIAEGHSVICGSPDLMRLVNVRVPYKLITDTSVLLAIDGVLFGIFTVNYSADPNVRKALVNLMRSNRHPVFAIRDFNITPEFIHDCFDVATDGYDFPPYVDRFRISEATPSGRNLIAAVVCKEGLGPLTDVADTGRSVYIVTKINITISLASAFLGIFITFLRLMVTGSVSCVFLLVMMLIFSLPIVVLSFFTTSVN